MGIMKKTLALAALCAALAGCSQQAAQQAVKSMLNDPDSAQFSDMRPGKFDGDVCGFINAKNRMGGYVGATRFAYVHSTGSAAILTPAETSDFRMVWLSRAGSSFVEDITKAQERCYASTQWNATCTNHPPMQNHKLCDVIRSPGPVLFEALRSEFDH